jgi:SAM-dependent methyltransferase
MGLINTIARFVNRNNASDIPYTYKPGHTVVDDYAEFSGRDIESIVNGVRGYKQLNKAKWAQLQGETGDWVETARKFYAASDNYVFDHLSANPTVTGVLAKLDRFNPQILKTIRSNPNKRLLEFGGGTGVFCESMVREGFEVTYLDIPGHVKDFAEWRFRKYRLPIEVITSTPDQLTLNRDYDIIFTDAVFEHLVNPEQALRELISHVSPNGVFVFIVDLSGPSADDPQHRDVDIVKLHDIVAGSGYACESGRNTFASIWRNAASKPPAGT